MLERAKTASSRSAVGSLPGKRERNALRNRKAILEAALEVFREVGYGAATVRDIIRRTGLASGTFYNYFPDKESVLRVLMEDWSARLRSQVHASRARAGTLEELVHSAFLSCFRSFAEDETMVELMLRNAGEIRLLTAGAGLEPAIEELAEDLRQKTREGIIPPIDIDYLARAMVAVAAELGFRMLERRPVDVAGTTDFAARLVLGGMERLTREG